MTIQSVSMKINRRFAGLPCDCGNPATRIYSSRDPICDRCFELEGKRRVENRKAVSEMKDRIGENHLDSRVIRNYGISEYPWPAFVTLHEG